MTTVEEVPASKERDRLAADLRPWVERNVVSPNAAYCGRCYDVVLRRFNDSPACQTVIKKPGKVVVEIPAWNRNYVSEEH